MKKIQISIISILFFSVSLSVVHAQGVNYSTIVKDINKNIRIGNLDMAVSDAQHLATMFSTKAFSNYIEKDVMQDLMKKESERKMISFIEKLYLLDDAAINRMIKPLYYYTQIKKTTTADSLTLLLNEYVKDIDGKPNYSTRRERYSLMILKELDRKKYTNRALMNMMIDKSIESILKLTKINIRGGSDIDSQTERAWFRLMLSTLCYYKYLSDPAEHSLMLSIAAKYCIDKDDYKVHHYTIFENNYINELTRKSNFSSINFEYADQLLSNGKKKEALDFIANEAVYKPSARNLAKLKDTYAEAIGDNNFESFWSAKIDNSFDPVPNLTLKTLQKEKIKLSETKGKWIFLDVWGTWCMPCVKSLPEIQKFYADNKENEDSPLSVYTLAYESTNLEYFLSNNNYTFPVAEVDRWHCEQLGVYYYPTKFLITPQGKLIKINNINLINFYMQPFGKLLPPPAPLANSAMK